MSVLLLYIIYNSVQWVACQSNKCNLAVKITVNKMDPNNKTIDVKSTGSEGYMLIDTLYDRYIVRCIINRSVPRFLPAYMSIEW